MSYLEAAVLGVLQGVAEFLPISSSGHLVVGHHLFGGRVDSVGGTMFFDVMLHMGTLFVVVVRFRRIMSRYLTECLDGLVAVCRGSSLVDQGRLRPGFRLAGLVLLTMAPLVPAAFLFKGPLEGFWTSLGPVSVCFLLTAAVLFLAGRRGQGQRDLASTGWGTALVIGVAQAVSLMPGISRSGMTIGMALLLGLSPQWAVEFSMLMSVPAIYGAALYSAMQVEAGWLHDTQNVLATLVGAALAFAVGCLALELLVRLTQHRRLSVFSAYLGPLGAGLLVLLATGVLR